MRKRCGNVIFFIQVSLDELDGIQQELEAALSAVVVRQTRTVQKHNDKLHIVFFLFISGQKARAASRE